MTLLCGYGAVCLQVMRHQMPQSKSKGVGYGLSGFSKGQNSLAQALTRLLGGKDWEESGQAYAVHVEDLCQGRLGLEPGRGGWVIPVLDELPSTIIAYALNSHEYHERRQEFYQGTVTAPTPAATEPAFHLSEGQEGGGGSSGGGNGDGGNGSPSSAPSTPNPYHQGGASDGADGEGGSSPVVLTPEELERQMLSQLKTHIKVTVVNG